MAVFPWLVFGILVGLTVSGILCYNGRKFPRKPYTDWDNLATGASGNIDLERAWISKVREVYALYCKKQHDYGADNISAGGLQGVAIRLGDKTSRLWELAGLRGGAAEEPAVSQESLRDTVLDMAGYAIIAALIIDGDWGTVSPNSLWGVSALEELLGELKGQGDEQNNGNVLQRGEDVPPSSNKAA